MSKKPQLIIIGVTSSLAGAFLKHVSEKSEQKIYGLMRRSISLSSHPKESYRESLSRSQNVETVEYDGTQTDLLKHIRTLTGLLRSSDIPIKVLNLASDSCISVLKFLQENSIPTLTIGSGSVIDWKKGRLQIAGLAANEKTREFASYIEEKARSE